MNNNVATVDVLTYLRSTSTFLSILVEAVDRMKEPAHNQDIKEFCHTLDLLAFAIAVDSARFQEESEGRVLPEECRKLAGSIFWLTLNALQSISDLVMEVRKKKGIEAPVEESLSSAKCVIRMLQERLESTVVPRTHEIAPAARAA